RRRHQSLADPAAAEPLSDDALESPPALVEPELEPEPALASLPLESDFAVSSFFDVDDPRAEELDVERSFFAQPEPLKWIAGAAKAFVIVPSAPPSGQNFGTPSLIPGTER